MNIQVTSGEPKITHSAKENDLKTPTGIIRDLKEYYNHFK